MEADSWPWHGKLSIVSCCQAPLLWWVANALSISPGTPAHSLLLLLCLGMPSSLSLALSLSCAVSSTALMNLVVFPGLTLNLICGCKGDCCTCFAQMLCLCWWWHGPAMLSFSLFSLWSSLPLLLPENLKGLVSGTTPKRRHFPLLHHKYKGIIEKSTGTFLAFLTPLERVFKVWL